MWRNNYGIERESPLRSHTLSGANRLDTVEIVVQPSACILVPIFSLNLNAMLSKDNPFVVSLFLPQKRTKRFFLFLPTCTHQY